MTSPQQQGDEEIVQDTPPRTTQSAYHTGHEEEEGNSNTNLDFDDVWGDDDDITSHVSPHPPRMQAPAAGGARSQAEVSDIPRLKQEHTTAGYRDGVTIAKAASVQAGFDEGYGLGASIGAYAGRLLGVLTGLVGALTSSSAVEGVAAEQERLQSLLETATKELSVLSVFGEEYFARDGTWRYEVDAPTPGVGDQKDAGGEGVKEEGHIVFADIAAAHPLVRKWDEILKTEARRYGLVWDVLLPEEEDHGHDHDEEKEGGSGNDGKGADGGSGNAGKKPVPVRQSKGALAW
ncbi:hypothetical protein V8F20_008163 [Naviculisporaceae sp. PSN 640]